MKIMSKAIQGWAKCNVTGKMTWTSTKWSEIQPGHMSFQVKWASTKWH